MSTPAKCLRGSNLLLIDGNPLVYKAFYSTPALTTSSGQQVGAAYTFCKTVLRLLRRPLWGADDTRGATYAAMCFDSPRGMRSSWRRALVPAYKAQRKPMVESLREQFPLCVEAAHALGLHVTVAPEDAEADDVLAAYALEARARDMRTVMVSPDKDMLQLVCDGAPDPVGAESNTGAHALSAAVGSVAVFQPSGGFGAGKLVRAAGVEKRFGVAAPLLSLALALAGDPADNIPGLKGVGEKTAAGLLRASTWREGHLLLGWEEGGGGAAATAAAAAAAAAAAGDGVDNGGGSGLTDLWRDPGVSRAQLTGLLRAADAVLGGAGLAPSERDSAARRRDFNKLRKWAPVLRAEAPAIAEALMLVDLREGAARLRNGKAAAAEDAVGTADDTGDTEQRGPAPLEDLLRPPLSQGSEAEAVLLGFLERLEFDSLLAEVRAEGGLEGPRAKSRRPQLQAAVWDFKIG